MCKGAKIQRRVLGRKTSSATEAVKAVSTETRSEHLSLPWPRLSNIHLYPTTMPLIKSQIPTTTQVLTLPSIFQ